MDAPQTLNGALERIENVDEDGRVVVFAGQKIEPLDRGFDQLRAFEVYVLASKLVEHADIVLDGRHTMAALQEHLGGVAGSGAQIEHREVPRWDDGHHVLDEL